MILTITLLAILGLCITIYSYCTELKMKQDPTYKPACDLSDRISCSKPMQSPYANLFFVSNTTLGILFYASMIILSIINAHGLLFAGALLSCIGSCYLAYILYVKIQTLCLLCTALYIINFLILFYSIRRLFF